VKGKSFLGRIDRKMKKFNTQKKRERKRQQ
jgi:hypothetical protein